MRFVVTYEKPGQIEGARLFDVVSIDHVNDTVRLIAEQVAGPDATIKSVIENDGRTTIGEFQKA